MKQALTIWLVIAGSIVNIYAKNNYEPRTNPKLIIGITIDYLSHESLMLYWDKYDDNGFKKLIGEGTVCKNARIDYYSSHNEPGYATLGTAAYPNAHGIVTDQWYNRIKDKMIRATYDEDVETLGGYYTSATYSPKNMLSSTWSDELNMHHLNRSKIIGISMDNEPAILTTGKTASAAYWFDQKFGHWVTNTYYHDSLPGWVEEFNKKDFSSVYLDREWINLLPMNQYEESLPDHNDYELGLANQHVFPYDLARIRRTVKDFNLLKQIPAGNTHTKDFAIAAIANENLGKDEYTDVLMLNFATIRYLYQKFGPRSMEMEDAMLRLDKDIAHFLSFIDDYAGIENTLIFLTSTNPRRDYIPYLKASKLSFRYFKLNKAWLILESYLNVLYGDKNWLSKYHGQQFYLNHQLIEEAGISLQEIQEKFANFLADFNGVKEVYTAYDLIHNNYTTGNGAVLQRSFSQNKSGDIHFILESNWAVKQLDLITRNTSNGHMPLIWYGWNIGHKIIHQNVHLVDIGATISYFMNIPGSNPCHGKPVFCLIKGQ
jgi:predicted AlkP superfamily pyrophosphatase or phosphodiesterase